MIGPYTDLRCREDAARRLRADIFCMIIARKDVSNVLLFEWLLQGRWWTIQQNRARAYDVKTLRRIMSCKQCGSIDVKPKRCKAKELRDKDTHISLQQNLMNHIWREVEEASEED
ncbi:hypothetical protein Tco_0510503 [Tanacetum coccineum]